MIASKDLKMQFGARLQRARKLRGLSLRALADKIDGIVTYAALQNYETGKTGPGSSVLIALCRALDLDTEYFFRQTNVALSGIEFRKKTKFTKTAQGKVEEEARDFFERYLEIEYILGLKQTTLPRYDVSNLPYDEELLNTIEKTAMKLRRAWNLGENPIQNLHEELEHAGVKVKEISTDNSFDGFSGWADQIPVIVLADHLNSNMPRKRFTAAHELGHLVLKLSMKLSPKEIENACHRFAGGFLMPAAAFKEFGDKRSAITIGELKALKADWGLSFQAIMRRFCDLNIIPPSRVKSFDYVYRTKYQWHKKGEPGEWIGTEQSTRFAQLVFHAAAEELITRSKAATLLQMPGQNFDKAMAIIA